MVKKEDNQREFEAEVTEKDKEVKRGFKLTEASIKDGANACCS